MKEDLSKENFFFSRIFFATVFLLLLNKKALKRTFLRKLMADARLLISEKVLQRLKNI